MRLGVVGPAAAMARSAAPTASPIRPSCSSVRPRWNQPSGSPGSSASGRPQLRLGLGGPAERAEAPRPAASRRSPERGLSRRASASRRRRRRPALLQRHGAGEVGRVEVPRRRGPDPRVEHARPRPAVRPGAGRGPRCRPVREFPGFMASQPAGWSRADCSAAATASRTRPPARPDRGAEAARLRRMVEQRRAPHGLPQAGPQAAAARRSARQARGDAHVLRPGPRQSTPDGRSR